MTSEVEKRFHLSRFSTILKISTESNVPSTPSLRTLSSVAYKNPKGRVLLERSLPPSSITQPNYEDILRRVSLVIHQHCVKCEARLAKITPETLENRHVPTR